MTAPTSIHIDEGRAEIIIAECDLLAIRQRGRVEVWKGDGETYMGSLPVDTIESQIRSAAEFFRSGFIEGVYFGRDEAQDKLRAVLGLEP